MSYVIERDGLYAAVDITNRIVYWFDSPEYATGFSHAYMAHDQALADNVTDYVLVVR